MKKPDTYALNEQFIRDKGYDLSPWGDAGGQCASKGHITLQVDDWNTLRVYDTRSIPWVRVAEINMYNTLLLDSQIP